MLFLKDVAAGASFIRVSYAAWPPPLSRAHRKWVSIDWWRVMPGVYVNVAGQSSKDRVGLQEQRLSRKI
jgi:hypothetical protein